MTTRPGSFNITDHAIETAKLKPGFKVLDVGCGEGDTVNHLNELGMEAEGIEMSLPKIADAKEKYPEINVKFGDGEFLDEYLSFTFDAVFMESVLSMINMPEEAMHEAFCVLKKGGRLIICDLYEIDPDPQEVMAVKLEADRQARIPHQEGDCEERTLKLVDFRYKGAFFKEPLLKQLEEIGFKVLAFEDRTEDLQEYIGQGPQAEEKWQSISRDLALEAAGKRRELGYFLLVAQKPF